MVEPDAAYTFTIPSVADDMPLDCRVYHPKNLHTLITTPKGAKGAIIAHPYAPLGGCFDDPIVLSVTETLLDEGFIVGTFNFRGAGDSQGKTSWTGKAEQADYASFAGFMTYYLQALNIDLDLYASDQHSPAVGASGSKQQTALLLGGYSYGSLILARLRPIENTIQRFQSAEVGSAAAEIILRARKLGRETIRSIEELYSPSSPRGRQLQPPNSATSPTKRIGASPITMGGEETDPSTRRRSRDSRRSLDVIRKSVEMPRRVKDRIRRHSTHREEDATSKGIETPKSATPSSTYDVPQVLVRYLVISPVLLPFTHTLCPPGPPSAMFSLKKAASSEGTPSIQFLHSPTLAIFGSVDVFTSSRRLRTWAERQSKASDSSFEWHEIEGAGHFWREDGTMQSLQQKIASWVKIGIK